MLTFVCLFVSFIYFFLDIEEACADYKLLFKKTGNSNVAWSIEREDQGNLVRRVATVTCLPGHHFVGRRPNYPNRAAPYMTSLKYYCSPQYTGIFVNNVFGHYVPKCVGKFKIFCFCF